METSVDTGRANEAEIEKERDDLRTRMKGWRKKTSGCVDLQLKQVEQQKSGKKPLGVEELALKTNDSKEVKKERKEKKKLERKEQLEREKKETVLSPPLSLGQIQSDEKTQALLAAENASLKQQKELKYIKDYIASILYEFTDNGVDMEKSVDTGRANEAEIEKELEKQKSENHWEVKYQALLDIEEKLRSRILEQGVNFQQVVYQLNQMTETKEEMSAELEAIKELALKTNDSKEVKRRMRRIKHLRRERRRRIKH
ncbi:unnamed protein product [Pleuronectes platessa]|uniref:Uncharacterized protein n=1 Tax=Pleuronectes platessa TaxID=8262 RepID=A0A9N7U1V0_PLEPL|nr:unnamed protein product [Pleuronectes platessa]